MPRGLNRVGVEVDPHGAVSSSSPTSAAADALKAKKAERRARARRRAEEKKLAAVTQHEQPEQSVVAETSPELDLRNTGAPIEHLGREKELGTSESTGQRDRSLSPSQADKPVAIDQRSRQQTEQQERSELRRSEPLESSHTSSLVQARTEYGTEEVLDVDARVVALNSELQQQQLAASAQSQPQPNASVQINTPLTSLPRGDVVANTPPKKRTRSPPPLTTENQPTPAKATSPVTRDAAAKRIQKALKRKFLEKALKKCTSFLRHSSKVFADAPTSSADQVSASNGKSSKRSASPEAVEPDSCSSLAEKNDGLAGDTGILLSERSQALHHQHRPASQQESKSRSATPVGTASTRHDRLADDESDDASSRERRRRRRREHRETASTAPCCRTGHHTSRSSSSSEGDVASQRSSSSSSAASSQSSRSSRSSSSEASDPVAATSLSSVSGSKQAHRSSSSKKKRANHQKWSSQENSRLRVENNSSNRADVTRGGPSSDLLSQAVARPPSVAVQRGHCTTAAPTSVDAATTIQAWLRGVAGRRRALVRRLEFEHEMESEALCEVHTEASVRIQAVVRGFLTRHHLDENLPSVHAEAANVSAADNDNEGEDNATPEPEANKLRPGKLNDIVALDEVAEWPHEFNIEHLDGWDELNSVANAHGDAVTHVDFLDQSKLRVFCGTWNLHAKKPQDDLRLWIPLNKYHIVAVGSEECVHSIAKSVVFTSKRQWERLLKDTLGDEYVLVSAHSLTAIHNVVFVHESVIPLLSNIQSDAVATGLGNQLGNKGGVGIAFSIGRTSFAFVNCHFDAHQQNTEKRNSNFHRINHELKLFPLPATSVTSSSSLTPSSAAVTGESSLDGLGKTSRTRFSLSSASPAGNNTVAQSTGGVASKKLAVSETFDRVFWFGDLNYRINGTRRMVDLLLLRNQFDVLRFNDQLQLEMTKGTVFAHFREGPLHFRPTYKFDKRSNVYDSSAKQRIPSWTDRILFLSNDKPGDIALLSYRSHMAFQSSDHRPVGAAFQVAFKGPSDGVRGVVSSGGPRTGTNARAVGGDQDFSRVLARGYRPSQAKSEVCVIQ